MRITQEADYAIRITYCLAMEGKKIGAKQIAESTGVSLRFALKILRKLILADVIQSYKGVNGGYELKKTPEEISLGEIIEIIDGPVAINNCLKNEFVCSRVQTPSVCDFHKVFQNINDRVRQELYEIKMDQFIK